jgi:hypothetical protein
MGAKLCAFLMLAAGFFLLLDGSRNAAMSEEAAGQRLQEPNKGTGSSLPPSA